MAHENHQIPMAFWIWLNTDDSRLRECDAGEVNTTDRLFCPDGPWRTVEQDLGFTRNERMPDTSGEKQECDRVCHPWYVTRSHTRALAVCAWL